MSREDLIRSGSGTRKIRAEVALALLESLRDRDAPEEVLEDENLELTLPRRLGLSSVVNAQISNFREEVRRGRRLEDRELRELVRLVTRRPDADLLFRAAGERLAGGIPHVARRRSLPGRLLWHVGRRKVRRGLRNLFGRGRARFLPGPFSLVLTERFLLAPDGEGGGCALVSGFSEALLSRTTGVPVQVREAECLLRGGKRCHWVIQERGVSSPETESDLSSGERPRGDSPAGLGAP